MTTTPTPPTTRAVALDTLLQLRDALSSTLAWLESLVPTKSRVERIHLLKSALAELRKELDSLPPSD